MLLQVTKFMVTCYSNHKETNTHTFSPIGTRDVPHASVSYTLSRRRNNSNDNPLDRFLHWGLDKTFPYAYSSPVRKMLESLLHRGRTRL